MSGEANATVARRHTSTFDDRQAARRDAARSAMVSAATHLLATKGYARTTLSETAELAGYSRSLGPFYFPSRAALLRAVLDEADAIAEPRSEHALAQTSDGFARLAATVDASFALMEDHADHVRARLLIAVEAGSEFPELVGRFRELREQQELHLRRAFELAMHDGTLAAVSDARQGALALSSLLVGLQYEWLAYGLPIDTARSAADAAVEVLGGGTVSMVRVPGHSHGEHDPPPPAGTTPKSRRGKAARDAMLEAATLLVAEGGLRRLTLGNVAEAAGYSRSLAAFHFQSKAGLMAALGERSLELIAEETRALGLPAGTGRERVEIGLAAIFQLIRHYPRLVRAQLLLAIERASMPEPGSAQQASFLRALHVTERGFRWGIRDRSIRSDLDPALGTTMLAALIHGVEHQWFVDPILDLGRYEAAARAFVDLLLDPVTTRAARTAPVQGKPTGDRE